MKPAGKFIVLGIERTGSNLLLSYLECHKNIKIEGEILNLVRFPFEGIDAILEDPVKYIKEFYEASVSENIKAIGFKIFYAHATQAYVYLDRTNEFYKSNDGIKDRTVAYYKYLKDSYDDLELIVKRLKGVWTFLAEDKSIDVIHLKRKNRLHSYYSLKKASITCRFFSITKAKKSVEVLKFNYEDIARYFRLQDDYERKYDELFKEHKTIDVYYNDLINNPDTVMNEIFYNLSLEPVPVSTRLKKQNFLPYRKVISNYSELKQKFENTKWAEYFNE